MQSKDYFLAKFNMSVLPCNLCINMLFHMWIIIAMQEFNQKYFIDISNKKIGPYGPELI